MLTPNSFLLGVDSKQDLGANPKSYTLFSCSFCFGCPASK